MQAPEEAGDRRAWRAVIADDDALARRTINQVLKEAGIIVVADTARGRRGRQAVQLLVAPLELGDARMEPCELGWRCSARAWKR